MRDNEEIYRLVEIKTLLSELQKEKSFLEDELFKKHFNCPSIEGSFEKKLNGGIILKCTVSHSYEIDEPAYLSTKEELIYCDLPVHNLVRSKLELNKVVYNKLNRGQKDRFNQVLIIKPSKPSIKVEFENE